MEGLGGEAAEDDRVRGADAGAGEHRDGGLGDHRQVDRDGVTCADPEVPQGVRGALDLPVQLGIGDVAGVVRRLTHPVDRDPVAVAGLHVSVDGVVAGVELAVGEPLREGRVPLQRLGEVLAPRHVLAGLLGPEALEVGVGLLVQVG